MSDRQLDAARRLIAHIAERAPMPLAIRLWDGSIAHLAPGAPDTPAIAVNGPDALARLARRPGINTLADLVAHGRIGIEGGTLLDVAARRQGRTKGLWKRLDKRVLLATLWPFLTHRTPRAGPSQAYAGRVETHESRGRDNKGPVAFHYDLSNEFYALFLDPEMVYTCAYFPTQDTTLEQAQVAKLDMVCRKLRLQPGDRMLDVGSGWGGLLCHAARHYGITGVGVTLAEEQAAYAREKIARLGLADRITILLRDYRDLAGPEHDGRYDKIASVGMFEQVGIDNHLPYFRRMNTLLRPRGLLLNHSIARPAKGTDAQFRKRTSTEYRALTQYIFPGGELDHIGMSAANLERAGFEVHDIENWREHYQRTCTAWTRRLHARQAEAEALIGPQKTRLWLIYLAGCALAFDRGGALIYQSLASKGRRGPSGLPPSRADLYW